MAFDAHKNFAYSTVATAPSPASSGTSLVVASGDGALFPAVSFNAVVWPANTKALSTNAEVVRVTAISTDTFTITRAQEGSSARSIVVGDQIAACISSKTITDIENAVPVKIQTLTGSSSAQLDFTTALRSYTEVEFRFKNVVPATNSVQMYMRLSSDTGSTFAATNYSHQQWGVNYSSGTGASGSGGTSATEIRMGEAGVANTSGGGITGSVWVNLGDGSNLPQVNFQMTALAGTTVTSWVGGGMRHTAAAYDAVRFFFSSGNISTGTITAYGYP